MNPQQRNELFNRARKAKEKHVGKVRRVFKWKPQPIRTMERTVARWERENWRAQRRKLMPIDRAHSKVRECIMFGEVNAALAAVKAFERKTPR